MSETDKNQNSLTGAEWSEVKEIFAGALPLDPEHRSQYIRRESGGNKLIIEEVESLLTASEDAGIFLESPAVGEVADEIAGLQSILNKGEFLKHYEIIRKIGAGGMSEVYLARDKQLDRRVAIKILGKSLSKDRSNLKRFLREAKIASGLNHPNIMTVHEIGVSEGIDYIVCEFIEGEILSTYVRKNDLRLNEVFDLLIQILAALVVAHKMGITHRDIKPENIMVRDDGFAKILDFGLAKLTGTGERERARAGESESGRERSEDESSLSLLSPISPSPRLPVSPSLPLPISMFPNTEPGVVMGTVHYMSPEQARGKTIDARTDLWSFGVILFQLLTGKLPFSGDTTGDVLDYILKNDPPKLSESVAGLPDELEAIINKCLQRDIAKRYQTAEELLSDLKKVREKLDTESGNRLFIRKMDSDRSKVSTTDENLTVPTDGRANNFFGNVSSSLFGNDRSSLIQRIRGKRFAFLPLLLVILSGAFIFVISDLYVFEQSFAYENEKLFAPAGEAEDRFGGSVAISGDTLVVGSTGNDDNGTNSGLVYVFVKSDTDWTLQQTLTPASGGQAFSAFGGSVDISGDTIIVGAGLYDDPGFNEGATYIFVRNGDKWIQQQKLVPSDPKIASGFGNSVALEGKMAIISADGSAYVFARNGTNWTENQKLLASDNIPGEDDQFGRSVDIAGDTIVIGSHYKDVAGKKDQGAAYIFVKSEKIWIEQQKLLASDGEVGDGFGWSVAISGNAVFVTAMNDDVGKNKDQGSAYVFIKNGKSWSEQRKLTASDGDSDDKFGSGLGATEDRVIIGAYQDDVGENVDQGSAHIFERNEGGTDNWGEADKLVASDGAANDLFGFDVIAISDDTFTIGAYQNDVNGNKDQGSAYVFSLSDKVSFRPPAESGTSTRPIANAGENQIVKPMGADWARVRLNGRGSSDPDGDLLTYSWKSHFDSMVDSEVFEVDTDPVTNATVPLGSYHEITLTVNDGKGGISTDKVQISVLYDFKGFFDPIDDIRANVVKAGQGIPFGFTLNGKYGQDIVASGYPVSNEVPCQGKEINQKEIKTIKVGKNSLTYDAPTDQYEYIWKTNKDWAGTCRHWAIKLNDGKTHTVYFKFK